MSTATSDVPARIAQQPRQGDAKPRRPRNISRREQRLSKWGGAALVLLGLKRGQAGGLLLTIAGGALAYRGWTGHCRTYAALGLSTADHSPATAIPAQQGLRVEQSVTINRPVEELYQSWQDLENLPVWMSHLSRVETLGDGRSHWVAEGPLNQSVEWDAEIIEQRSPELIAWRSLPGSQVDTAGSVRFSSLGHNRGAVVHVALKYNPPGGRLAASLAWLFGADLESQLSDDLSRFKSFMEAGEAPTTAGQSRGK